MHTGRKTLHGHWLLWVKNFKELRHRLFHRDKIIQEAARLEYTQYIDEIMCSSFGEKLCIIHKCGEKKTSMTSRHHAGVAGNTKDEVVPIPTPTSLPTTTQAIIADDLFTDNKSQMDLQRIRNAQNKNRVKDIRGEILKCQNCDTLFSTKEMLDFSLNYYKQCTKKSNDVILPMSKHRRAIATYRYPYDYEGMLMSSELGDNRPDFWNCKEARSILLQQHINEHDWSHRPSCFKKGPECRASLPTCSCAETTFHVEDEDESNLTTWYSIDGTIEETYPYIVQTKRTMGSQYLNTHSVPISVVCGCNTNVQTGEPCHMFYTCKYSIKNNQKEDAERFIRIGSQVCKRLMRMRTIALENATNNNDNPLSVEDTLGAGPDFTEGLSRMLSGMCACMSKAVCSSPMAHLIVSNDGSRFQYSHGHTHLLATQAMDVLEGKDADFRVRTNYSQSRKEKIVWPDSIFDSYRYRSSNPSDKLEDLCYYEFVSKFEKINKKFKQMNSQKIDGDNHDEYRLEDGMNDNSMSQNTLRENQFPFTRDHPGYEFSYLQRREHEVFPIISITEGNLCRIEELEIGSDAPYASAVEKREKYAKAAMIMFLPFRTLADLQDETGDPESKYWRRFRDAIDNNLLWTEGIEILDNIDHRETAGHMKGASEPLQHSTKYEKVEDEDDDKEKKKDHSDSNAISFELFDDDNDRSIDDDDYYANEGYTQHCERKHESLIGEMKDTHMISSRLSDGQSVLISSNNEEEASLNALDSVQQDEANVSLATSRVHSFDTFLMFINGSLVGGNYDSYITQHDDDESGLTNDEDSNDGMFANIDIGTSNQSRRRRIPTLIGVAQKIAQQEGKQLDEKQYAAYESIACSFLLSLIQDSDNEPSSPFYGMSNDQKEPLIQRLEARGGHTQLVMFLTGFAGAGKSTCVKIAQRFCFEFCNAVSIPWSDNTFLFTATTGSAASLFDGQTIHDAAYLNGKEKNISNEKREQWKNVRILIIDEISFFTRTNLEKLDRHLKNIMGRQDLPYGGVSIVFSGDFHQLPPVKGTNKTLLYVGAMNGLFESSINVAIILENSHRFDDDRTYGELMKRLWKGELTKEDIDLLNTRVVGNKNGLTLPKSTADADTCYACPFNKQRNEISAGIFKRHISSDDFPSVDSNELPPLHTIMIEAEFHSQSTDNKKGKTRVSRVLSDRIISTCGDSHCTSGQGKLVDPCLRLYTGAHVMCIDNSKLKSDNIGNGTLCRVKSVKLKQGAPPLNWKNWDGKKVWCVSARHVEYVEFERFPVDERMVSLKATIQGLENEINNENNRNELTKLKRQLKQMEAKHCFKLSPKKCTATVSVTLDDAVSERVPLKNVGMTQLPINMNDGTTGHKLQGMSKDNLIIVSWSWKPNWVYVVLSRVRTLKGLFLLKPLPTDCLHKFEVPLDLQAFERRMKNLERHVLNERKQKMTQLALSDAEAANDYDMID